MSHKTDQEASSPQAAPRRQLTLLDSTSIIVGIIIGSSIYKSANLIAGAVPSTAWLIAVWMFGGLLSLVGALCYAELANAYPTEGGDYVYLTRALGRKLGFLFAWAQLWVVRPGSIGGLAYVFADYANRLWPLGKGALPAAAYAVGAIVVLTAINFLGVREGKWTQNVLTIVKYLGLAAVVVAGFCVSAPPAAVASAAAPNELNLGFAMIFIFYAYGGWNEMAYVGSEVRDPQKNILRALVLGTIAVTALYVLLNLAFVHALGLEGTARSQRRRRRRAGKSGGRVGRAADQLVDLYFGVGSNQRNDLHRRESTTPWAGTIGSTPGWASGILVGILLSPHCSSRPSSQLL